MIKKTSLLILFAAGFFSSLFSQDLQHEVRVVNIEIPVRVFKGDAFIDSLTMDDFEVREEGKIQKIEAVYLIKKSKIEKSEETKKFAPRVGRRSFILLFELDDYLAELGNAIDYFFESVMQPGDDLQVVTPEKTYHLKDEALQRLPPKKISDQLKGKIRHDVASGSGKLRGLLRDLESVAYIEGLDEDVRDATAKNIMRAIREEKLLEEKKLHRLAASLKTLEGQKDVFLFYQEEALRLPGVFAEFEEFRRDLLFDPEEVKRAFVDAGGSIHLLLITKTAQHSLDAASLIPEAMVIVKSSQDFHSVFREMAVATGGLTVTSANPASSFRRAVEASANYYLLYYSPTEFKLDGKFRKIEVKIRTGGYRVLHRAGYIAH